MPQMTAPSSASVAPEHYHTVIRSGGLLRCLSRAWRACGKMEWRGAAGERSGKRRDWKQTHGNSADTPHQSEPSRLRRIAQSMAWEQGLFR